MENVEIKETKKGNPKYCLLDLPITINVMIDTENSCRVFIQSDEIPYQEINGYSSKTYQLYIASVKKETYSIFCQSLIHHIRSLSKQGLSIKEIASEIYNQYRTENETKKEMFNLQEEFKTVKEDFDNLKVKMDKLYAKMEML